MGFMRSSYTASDVLYVKDLECCTEYMFDPGVSKDFDYLLSVRAGEQYQQRCNVIRGASYLLKWEEIEGESTSLKVEISEPPERQITELLAKTPGLSFSFSASGWLFVYQLGAAECLQNHGVAKNPYVRVAGASGGALTVATMMYGCNMCALKDEV